MATFTGQQLVDRAAAVGDFEGSFVTPAQWLAWLNHRHVALQVRIARLGWVLEETTTPVAVTGAQSYSLGAEPLAVVGVYHVGPSGRLRRLRLVDPLVRARFSGEFPTGDAREAYLFRSGGNFNLAFYPVPTSGTYQVVTIAHPAALGSLSATVSYPAGWEEWLVLSLARLARVKEETTTSDLDRLLAEVDREIERAVWTRQLASCPAVRNVDDVERPGLPPPGEWFFP